MAIRPEGETGPTTRAIEVDLAGLRDLAKTVRQDNAATLEPQSYRVRSDLLYGVCFGATSASGYVLGAKQRYHESLLRALEQMEAHVRAASILADTAERVAKNYADADALSAARTRDVEQALSAAITAAEQVRHPQPTQSTQFGVQ
jgi:hypothetical protein